MIALEDLHGRLFFINSDMIERIECTPDTQVILSNLHGYYVKEKPEEIVERIIEFRKRCAADKEVSKIKLT
jgi:flagellar protein FlbD